MVRNLTILNSSYSRSRDLTWSHDPEAVLGFNIYRAFDHPTNWKRINASPQPGTFYREESQLEVTSYEVTAEDWVDNGQMGMRIFKIPEIPYSEVVEGRPLIASNPDDVQVAITFADGTTTLNRPGQVDGVGQTVWLRIDQALPVNGDVSAYPLIDFDNAVKFVATYRRLKNFVDISVNMVRTFYTVVPIGDRGEMHPPGVFGSEIVNTMEVEKMDYTFAEAVRRNAWMFEQVAEPAYIFFRRTCGEMCFCRREGMEIPRTACPSCFQTGIIGGYYGPYDFPLIDPDQGVLRTLDEGGVKVERHSRSLLGPTPLVQDGDLVVRRNGERLVVNGVVYKSPRGTLLQQEFDLQLLPKNDTRYLIPILAPNNLVIYNPVVENDPDNGQGGAEPLFSTKTDPNKVWENPEEQVGRTITWARIMT
jgi:hypothetical protein